MTQYDKAFRAYDIRGIFEKEVDAYFCFAMGYGVWKNLIDAHGTEANVLLGSDTRKNNKELIDHFIIWLTASWVKYIDHIHPYATNAFPYGIITSSAAYHVGMHDWDMTAIFTASHNPAEYVGIKIIDKKWGLADTTKLKKLFDDAILYRKNKDMPWVSQYTQNTKKVEEKIYDYQEFIRKKRSTLHKNHKFVVDFCHGAAVSAEKYFYENHANNHLITMINDYPDGTFPAHEWDTTQDHNYQQLIDEVLRNKAEFGIMFDGDADRIGFVSNTWEIIRGDIIYAIIVAQILKSKKEESICVYDCMSSKIVAETIQAHWGIPQINKVGRFFINHEMQRVWAIVWWEVSGHYMFWELWSVESVLLTQYYVMKASEQYNSFDDMVQQYKKYYKWQVQSLSVRDKEKVMQTIQTHFIDKETIQVDGISIYDQQYRCNIRPSNTEDKIRFTVEADNETIRTQKAKEITDIINNS